MKNCPVFICYRQVDGTKIAQWLFENLNGQRLPDIGHVATEEEVYSLDVYFDQTAPAVSNWKAIHQPRLSISQAMIIVCTPGSAQRLEKDDWVHREIDWWLKNRKVAPILIDATGEGERWVPKVIKDRWPDAQRITVLQDDLLRLQGQELRLFEERVRSRILNGIVLSKQRVVFEDLERQKRMSKRLRIALAAAGILLLSTVLAAVLAMRARDSAKENARIALARQLAAQAQFTEVDRANWLPLSTLLAVESMRLEPSVEADQVLRHGLALLPRLMAHIAHEAPVYTVAFSSDGKHLITISRDTIGFIESLWHWDVSTSRKVRTVRCDRGVLTVTYSLNGEFQATATQYGYVHVREVATDQEIAKIKMDVDYVSTITLSPNSTLLAVAGGTGGIDVFEVGTTKQIARMEHTTFVKNLAFSLDGKYLATVGGSKTARVWEVTSGKEIARMNHEGEVLSVAFSRDGKYLATASNDNTARLWELPSGNEILTIKHDGWVCGVAFSPDGRCLATTTLYGHGHPGSARLWDVTNGTEIARVGHSSLWGVYDIAFSPDGRYLATAGGKEKTAIVWASTARAEVARMQHDGQVLDMAFSLDGAYMVTAGSDRTARLWQTTSGREVKRMTHPSTVRTVAFSPEEKYIATGCWDRMARLWQTTSGDELAQMPHGESVVFVVFSPDGAYLATGSLDKTVRLWKVPSGRKLATMVHEGQMKDAAFSPDGRYLATAATDKTMRLWAVPSGNALATMSHDTYVKQVVFSPNGRYLVTLSGGRVRIWDLTTEQEISALPVLGGGYITFSPDGQLLAIASPSDRSVRLWEVPSGPIQRILVQDDRVEHVAFSPDSLYLATASVEGTTRIYDVVTGRECTRIKRDFSPKAVVFSRDGKYLATHSWDGGTAQVFFWLPQDLIVEASSRLGRNLTITEWRDHFGEELYRKTCPNLPIHHSFIEAGRDVAKAGDIEGAVAIFRRALTLEPGLDIVPVAEARKVASAFALVEKGKKLVKQGKVEEAISAYEKAQELDPTLVISASSWNILGRFGSLCGSPSEVMYACEKAVALEPANVQCRDTRGLARALTGDHTRAIEDFQFYIELGKIQQPEEAILKRQNWIQELKAGRNPFDEATLEALRNE